MSDLTIKLADGEELYRLPDILGISEERSETIIREAIMAIDDSSSDPRGLNPNQSNRVVAEVLVKYSLIAQTPAELAYMAFIMGNEINGNSPDQEDPASQADNQIRN